jgi:hypothetical protein
MVAVLNRHSSDGSRETPGREQQFLGITRIARRRAVFPGA